MGARSEISATMAICLGDTMEHGGKLIRHVGGYWSWPGCPRTKHNGLPEEYFGTSTVEALVVRGRMEYVEWKDGRGRRFPIVAQITEPRDDGTAINPDGEPGA